MKIGVLTYHRVVNAGSVIQAWCSVSFLKEVFPHANVELIDYRPLRTELRELRKFITKRRPFVNTRQIRKARTIRKFVEEYVPLSTANAVTDNIGRARRWLERQRYDVIFVGSDTVWELRDQAYSPEGVNLYFLPDYTGSAKVALSASMDPVGKLDGERSSELARRANYVNQFDLLTIRDHATAGAFGAAGVPAERMHMLPDPTFLADISELCVPVDVKKGDKLVIGVSLPRGLAELAHKSLYAQGFEVWDWNGITSDYCSHTLSGELPITQLLSMHQLVDGFVTDRFHASIFTLQLSGGPVAFYENPAKWPASNSKGRDLFCSLELGMQVFRDPAVLEDEHRLKHLVTNYSNVEGISQRIEKLRVEGRSRLRALLSEIIPVVE